jgi:hypothetical protein
MIKTWLHFLLCSGLLARWLLSLLISFLLLSTEQEEQVPVLHDKMMKVSLKKGETNNHSMKSAIHVIFFNLSQISPGYVRLFVYFHSPISAVC